MTAPLLFSQLLLVVTWVSIVLVLARSALGFLQLVLAAYVFATRFRPARLSQALWTRLADLAPGISVIAPAFNEELSIVQSVRALLALEYPDHEVIVVNDGSTDATLANLINGFSLAPTTRRRVADLKTAAIRGVYGSDEFPNLIVVDKENGRKADAANAGIGFAQMPLVCVIDADSIIETDGLLRATEPFLADDGRLVAVGGAIRIVNGCTVDGGSLRRIAIPRRMLPRLQVVEYLRAFLTARVANAHVNSLLLISGAFGIFRRSVLVEMGGYRHDTVGEDLELIVRMHRFMRDRKRPYRIDFVPEIVCWTEAPETLGGLRNQRARWQQGALETLARHGDMLFRRKYGRIGLFALPVLVIEDVIGPPAELVGYLVMPLAFFLGLITLETTLALLALIFVFGTALSIGALALEEVQLKRTPRAGDLMRIAIAALIENFGYRQANLVYRLLGMKRFFRREAGWSAVPRLGFSSR